MDERQKLYDDLKHYRAMLDLNTDEATFETMERMIREPEQRLAQLKNEQPDQVSDDLASSEGR
jgi:hypothetical protein